MSVIKCKMCGGDLALVPGSTVAECEYCGSLQTVPTADNEKKLTLFARANRLRLACEFDKAAGVYEAIAAEFPGEAEAYWGLVLCRYGIEYVDDPASGKKIPTCHRSSFESILEDSDYRQVLENADAVARRTYREEAAQIEENRKGIVAISASEEPYDIFICYKETDENGKRTLDSALAQDIYDALTAKGYRTFFSRISLEDKLGREYEPYIFAALNSAKIMLVVGTSYEHYNAVWVKNEWSRYLKLMTSDSEKHLIPCYKGIDAYDMPKEFAKLQAQDLGEIGAIQDILRGVEKLLPQEKTTVVHERIFVDGATGNKILSLLDRGNMALEDRDWDNADSFFEEVLNNDSKNAQADIGKALVESRCSTLEEFIQKRIEINHTEPRIETCRLEPDTAHIEQAVDSVSMVKYISKSTIRAMYEYDLSYSSALPYRKRQYHEETLFWENHRQLSRALKFATGEVAEMLGTKKQMLFTTLLAKVRTAAAADEQEVADLKAAYAEHIAKADQKVEKIRTVWQETREKNYQRWVNVTESEADLEILQQALYFFENQDDYKNCAELADYCRQRIEEKLPDLSKREQERIKHKQREIQTPPRPLVELPDEAPKAETIAYGEETEFSSEEKYARFRKHFWILFFVGAVFPGLIEGVVVQLFFLGPGYLAATKALQYADTKPGVSKVLRSIARILSLLGVILFAILTVAGLSVDLLMCGWAASVLLANICILKVLKEPK